MASRPLQQATRSKRATINGWLILDKPAGMTSTAALNKVKRLLNARKAGHAGTLDPLATGVLPIAFGEATKTVPYVVDSSKSYRFTVRWGAETTTDDSEGETVEESAERPSCADIEAELDAFRGEIEQTPPRFSAVKIEGARAYDLARDGEAFELRSRLVKVDRLEVVDMPDADTSVFEADCGKGTYVRAIARDLGRALGCYGHICALTRTRVGSFRVEEAVTLGDIEAAAEQEPGALKALLAPVHTALTALPEIRLSQQDAARVRRGQAVLLRGRDAPVLDEMVFVTARGTLVAVGEVAKGELEFYLIGWFDGTFDMGRTYFKIAHSRDEEKGYGGLNGAAYSDPEIDALLESTADIVDPAEREAALMKLNKMAMEDKIVWIPLHYQEDLYAIQKGRGIQFQPRPDRWLVYKEMARE